MLAASISDFHVNISPHPYDNPYFQESDIAPIEAAGVIPAAPQAKPTATVEKPSEEKEVNVANATPILSSVARLRLRYERPPPSLSARKVEEDGAMESIQVPGEDTSAVADPAPTVAADDVAVPSPGENTAAPDITERNTTDGNVRESTEEPDRARDEEPVKAVDLSAMETKVEGHVPESTTERIFARIFGGGRDRPAVLPTDDTPSDNSEEGPPAAVGGDQTCASSGGGDADTSTALLEDNSTPVSMEIPEALNEDGAVGEATIEASVKILL